MTRAAESVETAPTFAETHYRRDLSSEAVAERKLQSKDNLEITDNKVTSVAYPDGTTRKFTYDETGLVVGVTQPDGSTWSRTGIGDEWNIGGILKYTGRVKIDPKGTFSYEDWQDDKVILHSIDAAGKVTIGETAGVLIPEKELLAKYGPSLDWDKDGRLANAELVSAEIKGSRGQIPLAQSGLASRIRQSYAEIKGESSDKFGFEKQVTFKDIEKFSDRKEQLFKSERLWRRADELKEKYFKQVDSDADGRLSAKELEQAANLASASAPQREMYQTMKAAAGKSSGLSWQDITAKHRSIFESSSFDNTFKTTFGYPKESTQHQNERLGGYIVHMTVGGMAYTGTLGALLWGGPVAAVGYAGMVAGYFYYLQSQSLQRIEKRERESRYEETLRGRL